MKALFVKKPSPNYPASAQCAGFVTVSNVPGGSPVSAPAGTETASREIYEF